MILAGYQARHSWSRELNMQSSIISADSDAQITRIKEFGFPGRPRYFGYGGTVDPPDRDQGLLRRLHAQSDRRLEIGNVRGAERIKGNRSRQCAYGETLYKPGCLRLPESHASGVSESRRPLW